MTDSAFKDPPWLIVGAGGGYTQVTELLYRVAEKCTGEHTVDDIAAAITRDGTPVQSATVARLITNMLIPLGIVAKADGSVAAPAGAGRSLLALSMQVRMLSPRWIDPLAGVLKDLYFPLLLVVGPVVCGAALGWLFLIHGVASGIHAALYHPALMLLILLIVIIATAWHEFGHAAALSYGGGKVRGMGVGLYLIYPAFYTDVTDNYRLGRAARVRTDLGGFYFNLLFAAAMVGLYLIFWQPFLIVVALLLVVEILQQLLPFVRLDGYWTLVDVTGIPDFFSQIGPFLRTVLPLPWWKGKKLPELKAWGKAVFGFYTLLIIPTLALLLLLAVKGLPRVLATAWDSLQKQSVDLQHALGGGDVLGALWSIVQIITLSLPVLGLLYALGRFGKAVVAALWRWSAPSPWRRVVAGVAVSAAAVALLIYWVPGLQPWRNTPRGQEAMVAPAFRPITPKDTGTLGDIFQDPSRNAAVPVGGVATTTTRPKANPGPASPVPPTATTGTAAAGTPTPGAPSPPSSPTALPSFGPGVTPTTVAGPAAAGSAPAVSTSNGTSATGTGAATPTTAATASSTTANMTTTSATAVSTIPTGSVSTTTTATTSASLTPTP